MKDEEKDFLESMGFDNDGDIDDHTEPSTDEPPKDEPPTKEEPPKEEPTNEEDSPVLDLKTLTTEVNEIKQKSFVQEANDFHRSIQKDYKLTDEQVKKISDEATDNLDEIYEGLNPNREVYLKQYKKHFEKSLGKKPDEINSEVGHEISQFNTVNGKNIKDLPELEQLKAVFGGVNW